MSTREVLVTGGSGEVVRELARYAWPEGWAATVFMRAELDLTDTAAIVAKFAERPWAAVINPAAYTAVDKAGSDRVTA